ncbi:MAG: tryptophan synthase subunit alpha [Synergistaceae bacterium]|jgi:tryptophan synthase alpha chain|nr:tryptophan synthase subunit alpha [Synergistaceae bacterium]
MTTRYKALFEELQKNGEGAFIPFVMLGDPNMDESASIIETLVKSGADALELGIPFSDPVADGPVIQTAANRALESGITPDGCFKIIENFRMKNDTIPIGLLVYANLVIGRGARNFYSRAAKSGVDSVLIADVPTLASGSFVEYARDAGIDAVFIAPPNADDAKLREIAGLTCGYTYFLGRSGVTGADREMSAPLSSRIALLKSSGAPPVVVGFGISKPEHVRASLEAGADGAIAGSATVAIIERRLDDRDLMHEELARFVKDMKSATKGKG